MDALKLVITILQLICGLAIIVAVLVQSGKSAGFSGLGGGESLFGGKPTDMDEALARITVVLGLVFAVINVAIARLQ